MSLYQTYTPAGGGIGHGRVKLADFFAGGSAGAPGEGLEGPPLEVRENTPEPEGPPLEVYEDTPEPEGPPLEVYEDTPEPEGPPLEVRENTPEPEGPPLKVRENTPEPEGPPLEVREKAPEPEGSPLEVHENTPDPSERLAGPSGEGRSAQAPRPAPVASSLPRWSNTCSAQIVSRPAPGTAKGRSPAR